MSVTYLSLHLCASWVRARSSTTREEVDSSSIRVKRPPEREPDKNNLTRYFIHPSWSSHAHLIRSTFLIQMTYMHVLTGTVCVLRAYQYVISDLSLVPITSSQRFSYAFPFPYLSNLTHLNVLWMFVCVCVCMKYKGTEQENGNTLWRIESLVRFPNSHLNTHTQVLFIVER